MAKKAKAKKGPVSFVTKYHRGDQVRVYWPSTLPPNGSIVGVVVSASVQTGGNEGLQSIYGIEYKAQQVRSEHPLFESRKIPAGDTAAVDGSIIEALEPCNS